MNNRFVYMGETICKVLVETDQTMVVMDCYDDKPMTVKTKDTTKTTDKFYQDETYTLSQLTAMRDDINLLLRGY